MLVLETLQGLKGLIKMTDVWTKVGKFLGRAIALTLILCAWAIIIAFTLKVLWLIWFRILKREMDISVQPSCQRFTDFTARTIVAVFIPKIRENGKRNFGRKRRARKSPRKSPPISREGGRKGVRSKAGGCST